MYYKLPRHNRDSSKYHNIIMLEKIFISILNAMQDAMKNCFITFL